MAVQGSLSVEESQKAFHGFICNLFRPLPNGPEGRKSRTYLLELGYNEAKCPLSWRFHGLCFAQRLETLLGKADCCPIELSFRNG
jgi:hypothetical protein